MPRGGRRSSGCPGRRVWPEPAMPGWPELAMPPSDHGDGIVDGSHRPVRGTARRGDVPCSPSPSSQPAESRRRRHRASIAFGRKRGYSPAVRCRPRDVAEFAGLAGMPRGVPPPGSTSSSTPRCCASSRRPMTATTRRGELLLPGEHVPILLDDHGEPEFEGARAMLAEHRDEVPPVLGRPGRSQAPLGFLDWGVQPEDQVIRYAEHDGASIAWSAIGQGPPLVIGGWWSSHLDLDWRSPKFRRFVGAGRVPHRHPLRPPRRRGLRSRRDAPRTLDEELATLEALVDEAAARHDLAVRRLVGRRGRLAVRGPAPRARRATRALRRVRTRRRPRPAGGSRDHARDRRTALGARLPGARRHVPARRDRRRARRVRRVPAALRVARGRARIAARRVRLRFHGSPRRRARSDARAAPARRPGDPVRARQGARRAHPERPIRRARGRRPLPVAGRCRCGGARDPAFLGAPVASAASEPPGPTGTSGPAGRARLTDREREVLRLVARGETDAEIAAHSCSRRTPCTATSRTSARSSASPRARPRPPGHCATSSSSGGAGAAETAASGCPGLAGSGHGRLAGTGDSPRGGIGVDYRSCRASARLEHDARNQHVRDPDHRDHRRRRIRRGAGGRTGRRARPADRRHARLGDRAAHDRARPPLRPLPRAARGRSDDRHRVRRRHAASRRATPASGSNSRLPPATSRSSNAACSGTSAAPCCGLPPECSSTRPTPRMSCARAEGVPRCRPVAPSGPTGIRVAAFDDRRSMRGGLGSLNRRCTNCAVGRGARVAAVELPMSPTFTWSRCGVGERDRPARGASSRSTSSAVELIHASDEAGVADARRTTTRRRPSRPRASSDGS